MSEETRTMQTADTTPARAPEEARTMQTADTTPARAPEDAPALVKKIGKTTYKVRVHFSQTSTETMSDKIKRMLKNEIQQM